jgi:hypothetical protein
MKGAASFKAPPVCIDIGPDLLVAVYGDRSVEVPLDRTPNGMLTEASRQKVIDALRGFVPRKGWQSSARGICALPARGVSLRPFTIPFAKAEETERLLALQIENDLPLSPDELAWGWITDQSSASTGTTQSVVVAAVKKEMVEQYANLFAECGITTEFTLGSVARANLLPSSKSAAFLHLTGNQSEWTRYENGRPTVLRIIPFGTNHCTSSEGRECLGKATSELQTDGPLYISGNGDVSSLVTALTKALPATISVQALKSGNSSASIAGLQKMVESGAPLQLAIRVAGTAQRRIRRPIAIKKQAVVFASLLIGLLALPYVEAIVLTPYLRGQITKIEAEREKLKMIDRELSFLENLKQTQPPHLDALYIISKAAPSGTRLESVSMNRRGEVVLRGALRDGTQVSDFRNKLIDSGFFSTLTVEEQSPTPDRQKVNFRMTAQWKPLNQRLALKVGPGPDELKDKNEKGKPNAPSAASAKGKETKP